MKPRKINLGGKNFGVIETVIIFSSGGKMDATKQKLIDVCRINIEDDEMWIKLAKEKHEDGLLAKALADKEYHEKKLSELLAE